MTKFLSVFGFFGGVALLGALYLNAPVAGPVEAREEGKISCRMVEVALDEGYGVTRTELRNVCAPAR